jgi:asparagine synthase (glutamine-hydrolysing)
MCGLVGCFRPFSQCPSLMSSLRLLRHRGPDDFGNCSILCGFGEVSFGHQRLSIIDLSNAGRQPMSSSDGRFTIVFNGEIYNYETLRSDLLQRGCVFHGQSDTEVLLAAWSQWGINTLCRLEGMFAFAVFDRHKNTITLARDAFGIKPLYFCFNGNSFGFASEISALLELFRLSREVNERASYEYLAWGRYDDSTESFFKDVNQIPPGHYLEVNLALLAERCGQPKTQRWWSPGATENIRVDFHEAAITVRENFLSSVRSHLRSDVPLALSLSGGIDSTSVLAAVRHAEPDAAIHCFSYIADQSDLNEKRWVDVAARAYGAVVHEVELRPSDVLSDLEDLIRSQGEPFGGTSIYAQYRLYKAIREQGFIVVLEGQGADELYAGYHGFPGSRIHSFIDAGDWVGAGKFLRHWAKWPGRSLSDGIAAGIAEIADGPIYQVLSRLSGRNPQPAWLNLDWLEAQGVAIADRKQRPDVSVAGRRLASRLGHTLTRQGLPALLRHGDRNSMRFSVESRVPFLTTDQASFALSLPENYLVSDSGETKRVFRAAMRGIVPDEILDRRDKIGFKTPESMWIRSILANIDQVIDRQSIPDIFNKRALLAQLDQVIAGTLPANEQVWRWINYLGWYRQFIKS